MPDAMCPMRAGCERDPSGQRPPDPPFVVCSFARFHRAIADPMSRARRSRVPRVAACGEECGPRGRA
jgi:hypothetical protein